MAKNDKEPTAPVDAVETPAETVAPTPRERRGDLTDSDKKAILERFNAADAVISDIADDFEITPARVYEVVNELNGVEPEDQ